MIEIVENKQDKIVIKDYPYKYWLVYICLTIATLLFNYETFVMTPLKSTLDCQKGFLNTNSCQITEYSLFNRNLIKKKVNNIHHVKPSVSSNNRNILLKTELKGNVQNVYFPSRLFFNTPMYTTEKEFKTDIQRINNFINRWQQDEVLIINKKIPILFYVTFLAYPLMLIGSISAIFTCPILTYIFNFLQNYLIVEEKALLSKNEQNYSINKLKLASVEEQKNSILLNTNSKMSYLLDDFQNQQEAVEILNILKQHIK